MSERSESMTEYEVAQLNYWRDRAKRLEAVLEELSRATMDHVWEDATPPEPPVGTVVGSWTRKDDGWHCALESCFNCPCEWSEAYEIGGARP